MRKIRWYFLWGACALLLAVVLSLCYPKAKPRRVTITWTAPSFRNGAPLVGYNVYRRTVEDDAFIKVAEKVSGLSYQDRQVTSGRKYFYVVTSMDNTGRESRFSDEVKAEIP